MRTLRWLLIGGLLLAACAAPAPTLTPKASTAHYLLPTLASDAGGCADVGLEGAVLLGNPADPRVAWLDVRGTGGRREIVWPPAFTARFTPELEVLDAAGSTVFRAGDSISGGCVVGPAADPTQLLLVRPGF